MKLPKQQNTEVAQQMLPLFVQQRVEVIQELLAAQGSERYGQVQQQGAKKLGMSVRSLQRLMQAWRTQGLAGLYRQTRSDSGTVLSKCFLARVYPQNVS